MSEAFTDEDYKRVLKERDSYRSQLDRLQEAIVTLLGQRLEPCMSRHPVTVVMAAGSLIAKIGEAIGCDFEDGDDLLEAVKELVRESDTAREQTTALKGSLSRKVRHCDEITEERDHAIRERDEARAALAACPDCAMYAERSGRFAEQADTLQRERDLYLRERDEALARVDSQRSQIAFYRTACTARFLPEGFGDETIRELIKELAEERDEARAQVDELRGQYQYSVGLSMALEERDQARRERDEARREADRFRHGCTVEGDFVCPNEHAVSELTAERNFLRALKKNHEEDFTRVCKERDEARAEVDKLSESSKAAWEAECVMREQRDRYHAEWKQERQEVERLRTALLEVQTSESAPAWFADGFHDGWKAGAEAMREACAAALMADGLVLSRERAANVVRALPIPEEP